MVEDFSTLVERGAPPTSDSDAVRAELRVLACSTHGVARGLRRRRPWRIAVPAVSIALVLGGVTSAAASPSVQGWWTDHVAIALPWQTGPNACVNAVAVASDPEQPADPASLAAAKVILRQMDFSKIEASAAYKTAFEKAEKRLASTAPSPEVLKYNAQGLVLDPMIIAKLHAEGVDTTGMVITGVETCADGTR